MRADPKSAKNIVKLSVFFAILGAVQVKAARKMLLKLTPGVVRLFFLLAGQVLKLFSSRAAILEPL